jgi:hypothetical protein
MSQDLILAEWHRAQRALRAAKLLLTNDECFEDAVSRAYYAILHAAKAALYSVNATAKSHAAVRRLFGLHLIKTGALEKDYAVYLGESLGDRLTADYDPQVVYSPKEARDECKQASRFLRRIRRFLLTKGFTPGRLRPRRPRRG